MKSNFKENNFYHRSSIKNLSPDPPPSLPSFQDEFLLGKIRDALEKRGWSWDWLEVDLENHVLNLVHPSITREESIDFYDEIFEGYERMIDFDS